MKSSLRIAVALAVAVIGLGAVGGLADGLPTTVDRGAVQYGVSWN